jgi:uncharacterized protein (DUF1800 family)
MLKPLSSSSWNYSTAAHLLNRAGFGGTPSDINVLFGMGQDKALASLLDYENVPDPVTAPEWAHPDPERIQHYLELRKSDDPTQKRLAQREEAQFIQKSMVELRGWWLNRMACGPRPLQEKMTLFWHGHFATSVEKVKDPYYMWRQNELFRRLATDNWEKLLLEAGQDPAMLVWLDQAQSRKGHPNENYARENMELFSLGEGHYTEHDVTESARALTGWSLDRINQKYIYRPYFHDNGDKVFLGREGNLDGNDVISQIVAQPQAALFITAKLWNYFAGQMPPPELNEALAAVFRDNNNNFKPLLAVMFRCEEFYSPDIIRNLVKSPVQWLVGSVRMLQCQLPPPLICMAMLRQMGQDLFAPPNVKGWDGGITWITTNTLLTRYNDAQSLVRGTIPNFTAADFARKANTNAKGGQKIARYLQNMRMGGVDLDKILTPAEMASKDALLPALETRLLQAPLSDQQKNVLDQFLDAKTVLTRDDILTVIRLVMSTPEYQVA